jgi:sugar/nucleoside kinase (ribokinase family)
MIELAGIAEMRNWINGVDILFPNADEARVLTGTADMTQAAKQLLEIAKTVVVKLGAAGAMQVSAAGEVLKLDAPAVTAVDATGAGDAFVGGYLATWLKTHDGLAALRAGIAAGSECVQHIGARPIR